MKIAVGGWQCWGHGRHLSGTVTLIWNMILKGVEYFVSYYTLVAVRLPDDTLLFNGDTYSVTTTQQIYKWCGIPTAERRKGMKEGIYGTFYTHGYNVF